MRFVFLLIWYSHWNFYARMVTRVFEQFTLSILLVFFFECHSWNNLMNFKKAWENLQNKNYIGLYNLLWEIDLPYMKNTRSDIEFKYLIYNQYYCYFYVIAYLKLFHVQCSVHYKVERTTFYYYYLDKYKHLLPNERFNCMNIFSFRWTNKNTRPAPNYLFIHVFNFQPFLFFRGYFCVILFP